MDQTRMRDFALAMQGMDRYGGGSLCWQHLQALTGFVTLDIADGCPPALVNRLPVDGDVIVSAHYDTLGEAWTPGGCDNASGCAVVHAMAAEGSACYVLLPQEEPPYFSNGEMGSSFLARWMSDMAIDPFVFFAVDTVGGMGFLGGRRPELCGDGDIISAIRGAFPDRWATGRRLHLLSDARNFRNGVLVTDEMVLRVPMHSRRDDVASVDWDFVFGLKEDLVGAVSAIQKGPVDAIIT